MYKRVPALRVFWDLEKTVLHETRVSGIVLWSPTNTNSPAYKYISKKKRGYGNRVSDFHVSGGLCIFLVKEIQQLFIFSFVPEGCLKIHFFFLVYHGCFFSYLNEENCQVFHAKVNEVRNKKFYVKQKVVALCDNICNVYRESPHFVISQFVIPAISWFYFSENWLKRWTLEKFCKYGF